jgi:AcrR family transcriptional regulator
LVGFPGRSNQARRLFSRFILTTPSLTHLPLTRRQDLIRIAAIEFSKSGYRATTLRQIADAAGILAGSLYHHFASKEEILREVMLSSTADYVREIESLALSGQPASELVRQALEQRLNLYRTEGLALGVVLQTDKTTLEHEVFNEMRDLGYRIERAWSVILEHGVKDGSFAADLDIKATTYAIQGMVNWAHRWFNPDGRLSAQALAHEWAKLLLRGLEKRTIL